MSASKVNEKALINEDLWRKHEQPSKLVMPVRSRSPAPQRQTAKQKFLSNHAIVFGTARGWEL